MIRRSFDGVLADPVPVHLDPDGTPRLATDGTRSYRGHGCCR